MQGVGDTFIVPGPKNRNVSLLIRLNPSVGFQKEQRKWHLKSTYFPMPELLHIVKINKPKFQLGHFRPSKFFALTR